MKQHDITKICADTLRAFANDNYGIKLKPSHAHELVAAYLGYKSKAALLADTTAPISNLQQALYIVLAPTSPIDQRRRELEELSSDLPDTYILSEGVYTGLYSEKLISKRIWPTYDMLAIAIADDYLRQQNMQYARSKPTGEGVKVEQNDNSLLLTVSRFYQVDEFDTLYHRMDEPAIINVYLTIIITLPRIAAHIGYGMPDISLKIEKRKIGEDWS